MRWLWPLFLLWGCSAQPPIPPGGIVSNNPCIDAILAEVAAPGQIAAVSSYSHDPVSGSAPLDWARAHPALGTSAEEIIAAKPRLVLTGNLASSGTNAVLSKAGVKLLAFGVPVSVAESVAQVRAVADALGRGEAGEELVRRIENAVKPSPLQGSRTAIIWQGGGFVAGEGTLQDELLIQAGFTNASAQYGLRQWDILPVETLLRNPPNMIFMPSSALGEEQRALTARVKLLGRVKGKARVLAFPDKLLFCGGPTIVEAMRVLKS